MTATPPTETQIRELAERRTATMGYPAPPPASAGDLRLYHQQRDELLANQTRNAELELTRRYELARDREQQATAREREERAALEAQLKADYMAAAPGTSEADAERALPDLLHRHRLARIDEHEAAFQTARRRMSI